MEVPYIRFTFHTHNLQVFQAKQLILLVVFQAIDEPIPYCMVVYF